jgi:hypothetical protein
MHTTCLVSTAEHAALHHLDLVFSIALDNTAADIPAEFELIAVGRVGLGVGRTFGVYGVVRCLHGRSGSPVASINALVKGAAVYTESLLLDLGTLNRRKVGRVAVAARVGGFADALTAPSINCVPTSIGVDLAMGMRVTLGLVSLRVLGIFRIIGLLGIVDLFRVISMLGVFGVFRIFRILVVIVRVD